MALWVCAGPAGCGTKYAVGLFKCPRCHNTEFFEDGDPMAKITRHGGASDKTLPVAEGAAVAEAGPAPEVVADQPKTVVPEMEGEPGPELVGMPDSGAVLPAAADDERGEESSPGSSSAASTEKPQPTSEPSKPSRRKPARKTASRSVPEETDSSTAPSTAGDQTDATSTTDGES